MVDSFASALKINLWLQTNGGGALGGGCASSPEKCGQCLIIWHSVASSTAAASFCSNEPMPTTVPAPRSLPAQITRYGLSELLSPSCRLCTKYACAFVFIRLAAQQNETLAQLYINKHMAPRKRKMGTIGSKRVVVRWLEECWRNVFLMAPSKL